MNVTLANIGECRYFSRHAEQYFMFLAQFAKIGLNERRYLIQNGIITIVIQLLNGESPDISREFVFNKRVKTNGLSSQFGAATLFHMLDLINLLVLSCETSVTLKRNDNVLPPTMLRTVDEPRTELPTRDRDKLFYREFFACLVCDSSNVSAVQGILNHWCWENLQVTINFVDTIIKEMALCYSSATTGPTMLSTQNLTKSQMLERLMMPIEGILSIADSIHQQRVDEVLKMFLRHVQIHSKEYDLTLTCINFLTSLAERLDSVSQWLQRDDNGTEVEKIRSAIQDWNARMPQPSTPLPTTVSLPDFTI